MTTTCEPTARVETRETVQKPVYHIHGNEDAYEVRAEMPGVPKSGVFINLEDSILTIRGKRAAVVPGSWKTLHSEISTLDFLLRLRLNTPVDEERLKATVENGVLSVHLPVKEAAKPRRIEVR
jgi:HSP20 family protein